MRCRVNHPAGLVLPGDDRATDFGDGVTVDVKNPAVAEWIAAGWLVPVEPPPVARKGKAE